jgi:hypothetical protein
MFRKTVACLLVVAYLANVGCTSIPVPARMAEPFVRDLVLKRLAAIWKNDIPIRYTDHALYPTVERLPGPGFTPMPLPLADLEDTTLIGPGDYEIPAHFYCTGVYMPTGSGYRYRLAKLEGKFSEALTQLYVRASQAATPTNDVQMLSWSLQTGIAYDDLNPPQRALVDRLIPEYRAQMQLGLAQKLIRDWETWGSRFPLLSLDVILAHMGEVGTYLAMLKRARQDILHRNYRYDALWAVFAPRRDAPAPVDQEKSPWSRIHQRIYMRFIAPTGAKSDGVIQLRIVDGHNLSQQPSNATLVREVGPSIAQMAFADALGPDGFPPPMITQDRRIAGTFPMDLPDIPEKGAIPAGKLREPVLRTIGIGEKIQAVTATIRKVDKFLFGKPSEMKKPDQLDPAIKDFMKTLALVGLVLGIGGGLVGVVTIAYPSLRVLGVLITLTSSALAYFNHRLNVLANDPPRDDIDVVSRFNGLTFDLPAPADDHEVRWQVLIKKLVSTAVCVGDLIRSLERVDGALLVQGRRGVQFVPQLSLQKAAVQHNATACAALLRELSVLTQPTNEAWHTLIDILTRHRIDPATLSPQEIRTHLRTVWGEQKPRLRTQWGLSQTEMAALTQAVETEIERMQGRIPRLPDVLLDDTWKTSLESLAQALEQLAVAYATSTLPRQPAPYIPPASRR